ncbi:hypothetical protein EON65_44050 [archaeon]|nr:MAG: hypothetical protein EON65_44050 [archaeon]
MVKTSFMRSAIRRSPLRSLSFTVEPKYFPYCSWASIKANESFHVDKTKAIKQLESMGKHPSYSDPVALARVCFVTNSRFTTTC